jgi:hypothetical protein
MARKRHTHKNLTAAEPRNQAGPLSATRSAPQPHHALPQLFIGYMSVSNGGQRTHVPREPLREE